MITVSENISLRLYKEGDALALFNILDTQREYMREWLPFVDYTKEVADTAKGLEGMHNSENPLFIILYDENIVGLVGFKDTSRVLQKTEIGYWISQKCGGKGVMTQSVVKLLEYAFLVMKMNRLVIKVAEKNQKSRNIPERIGFVQEGIERESELLVDGVFADIVVYSMLKREYLEKIENGEIKIS